MYIYIYYVKYSVYIYIYIIVRGIHPQWTVRVTTTAVGPPIDQKITEARKRQQLAAAHIFTAVRAMY